MAGTSTVTIPPLITAQQVLAALDLSTADAARVPTQILAASRFVRKWCDRFFTRRPSADGTLGPIDIVVTPPLRGTIILPERPVNEIWRVSGTKTVVLTVTNDDATTNQRAVARLIRTGGEVQGYQSTGIYLERWASGVMLTNTINFADLTSPTVGSLANAVNAVGGGWVASASGPDASGSQDYALWPVIELRPGQGAQGALQNSAQFEAWTEDLQIERDDEAGLIRIVEGDDDAFTSLRWGPTAGLSFGDDSIRGGSQGIRIVYDGGYDTIPEDLADATIEVVKTMLERKAASATVLSERTLDWTIVNREVFHAMPISARETLAQYRSHAE